MLTLSYSDLLTDRGFKYIFQTAATAGSQSEQGLPQLMKLAEAASGKRPKTRCDRSMDNTATSVATAKMLKEKLFAQELGLQLVMDEVWTPPLADATPLIQKVRVGAPRSVAVHAERRFGRQTRAGKDQRVRLGPGQDSDRSPSASRSPSRTCCRASRRKSCRAS